MSIPKVFRSLVLDSADVTALIGTNMYTNTIPSTSSLPAVAYSVVSTGWDRALDSRVLRRTRIQTTVVADTYDEAIEVADAIIDAVDNYRGDYDTHFVSNISVESRQWQHLRQSGRDESLPMITMDFLIRST